MEALRQQRGAAKTKVTKLEKKVDTERNSGQQISKEKIEVYLARLEDIRCEFDDVQQQINAIQVGDPTVAEATEDEAFGDRYLNLKILLKEMLASVASIQAETRPSLSDEVLVRVLQQQSELMRRFGENSAGGDSQATTSNNDAIAQLVQQQTELLRRFADGGSAARNDSSVKLPVIKLPMFAGRTE
ncbi:uncharacterized protein LOC107267050 [Cephus cinctus]|uniref:Uncharacterized protein LOC107267050 n=1 Tax=Cephus cinctus TaxID=211228 RepID=A0AAJ7BTA3_CEPCN|nr:uncharacterized protein LOC107267050 [Cephus cinctus]